ncbi:MAG TPA: preprotein translocase subunit SecY [Candidatus Paceibacterota bacterium]|nr:preprotein translocase subunit SecY [Candidatus Paceibacterota bacterium]
MDTLLTKLQLFLSDSTLRARVLFVLGILVVFRALAAIPVPGVDALRLEQFFNSNQILGFLNIFSGGGLSSLSIVMLGVGPFITASIIMQLATMLSPRLKAMYQEDGEAGRKRFGQYSRLLSVPLALIQGFSFLVLLERQQVLVSLTPFDFALNLVLITAGSMLLMWLGELVSEYGVGNGVSLIIFAGIVSQLPTTASQLAFAFDPSQIPIYLGFTAVALLTIAAVVSITEAERPIPVTYARRVRGAKVYGGISTYLPLRVNQAGVIPIIFALSILLFPQMLSNLLSYVGNPTINSIGAAVSNFFADPWVYGIGYFILVFLFTYFYTAVTFDPDSISSNLQKSGAFVPGVRPGSSTSEYLSKILVRITFVGALFLGVIAVLPLIMQGLTGVQALAIGGTALLIVVSVVLDLIRKIDAQVSMREY